ncbi:MAG: hypothetical protein IJ189_03410 [Clostridia bacterium]|nr:hypothetical protein [Clostridia bacterium]
MITIKLLGKIGSFEPYVTVQKAIDTLAPEAASTALGCFCGGKVLELNEKIQESCRLHPITFQNEEGRRIYERSLRFVMLLAVKRVLPEKHMRIEHSIGYGMYVRLLEGTLDEETIERLQAEMERIVKEDLPFIKERWTRNQAIAYFPKLAMRTKPACWPTGLTIISTCIIAGKWRNIFMGPCCPPQGT